MSKRVIYITFLMAFVIYLFSANYIFNVQIKASDKESDPVDLKLKEPNQDVIFFIDNIDDKMVKWKELTVIQGWGFLDGFDAKDIQHYIFIKRNDDYIIYDTIQKKREDVTEYYKEFGLNVDDCGFEAVIPKYIFENSDKQVGLYIVLGDKKGMVYFNDEFYNH